MHDWQVVLYTGAAGVPQQTDGSSCGVFTCVVASHLVKDATLPDIQAASADWRRWIAATLVERGEVLP
jgi:Ulp1 family protease